MRKNKLASIPETFQRKEPKNRPATKTTNFFFKFDFFFVRIAKII